MDKELRELIILHSNDIHGRFAGEKDEDGKMQHSLAQVAGYVSKVKKENPDTVYCIAGDVFQGSLIDSDFQGLSTMDILNLIDIDLMSIGNHELDYGISHMMFVSRYADFPILNANFRIRKNNRPLLRPYKILEVGGFSILFIGLITAGIVDQTKAEGLVGTFVEVTDAAEEVRKTIRYATGKRGKPDMTVLMTHIGFYDDLELARALDPSLGVKAIIGGHSHTYLEEPSVENGIVIVQAGKENTHLGELHLFIDPESKKTERFEWKMVPVDEDHCPEDKFVKAMVNTYLMDIDEKYGTIITRFKRELDNYGRGNTTEIGQLFVDAFTESLDIDLMLMASSSTRCYKMDMTVTLQDLREAYPYDGKIYKVKINGKQLKHIIKHMLRDEVLDDWKDAFFHTSKDLHIVYKRNTGELKLSFRGKPVTDKQTFRVGIQEFYYINAETVFGLTCEELAADGGLKTVSNDAFGVLKEYFSEHSGMGGRIDDRIQVI
jgi:5'-nucleotidase